MGPTSDELEFLRATLDSIVPFAEHVGVEILDVGNGTGSASLHAADVLRNHVGTVHAGALFTVAEAASGAAMAGTLASVIADSVAAVKRSSARLVSAATGPATAIATVAADTGAIRAEFGASGRVEFTVSVQILSNDQATAEMDFDWVVQAAS